LKNPIKRKKISPVQVDINTFLNPQKNKEENDPWFRLPESSREKAYQLLKIVNHARDIHARTKKGKTKALKKYAHRENMSLPTLLRHMKTANTALQMARHASDLDTTFAQMKALTPSYGKNKDKYRSFDENAIAFALSLYLNQKHLNITAIYKETVNTGTVEGWRTGSYDALRDIIYKVDGGTKTLARKGNK